MADGGHPVKAPLPGQPAQAGSDLVQALDQMRLILALGQPAPPPARVRQRAQ